MVGTDQYARSWGPRSVPMAASRPWRSMPAERWQRRNGSGSVVLLGDNARVLASGGAWTALAFLPNGNDLLAADGAGQTLTLIQDVQNTAAASVVLSVSEKPGALVVSADGSEAALGLADNVTIVNLASGVANSIACGCQAASFDLLQGNLVARIIDAQTGSQLLLDADSAQPRIASLPDLNLGVFNEPFNESFIIRNYHDRRRSGWFRRRRAGHSSQCRIYQQGAGRERRRVRAARTDGLQHQLFR